MATYDIIYDEGWWITRDGKPITILGCFEDPVTPKIIKKEIEKNGEV